ELEETARRLLQLAEAQGVVPRQWAKRFVDLRQTQLSRDEANRFFASLARTDGRLFHVEALDVAVTGKDMDLFSFSNAPVSLSVRGTLLFRADGEERAQEGIPVQEEARADGEES
ncbi:MAG: hypothetical protein LBJ46_11795, partial [Planctomycetota bacterium]|nr:hypothetical protein [Planctomycetota bacterium]